MKKSGKKLKYYGFFISLVVLFFVLSAKYFNLPFFHQLELKVLDSFFKFRGIEPVSGQVVIVAVDDKSLSEVGRWPWQRDKVSAKLLDKLNSYNCAAIGFDVVFSEPQLGASADTISSVQGFIKKLQGNTSPVVSQIDEYLGKLKSEKSPDSVFADSISEKVPSVLGLFFFMSEEEAKNIDTESDEYKLRLNALKPHRIIQVFEGDNPLPPNTILTPQGVNTNIPVIARQAFGSGFFNVVPDIDGVIRQLPLVCCFDGEYYPSLSLAVLSAYFGKPVKLFLNDYGIEKIQVGTVVPPVSLSGEFMVNYPGPPRTIKHYSASDILTGRVNPSDFKGKIVLIGITATGVYDIRITPFGNVYPGVEIHAAALDNMITGNYIIKPWWADFFTFIAIILTGLAIGIVLPRLRPASSGFLSLIIILCICLISFAAFRYFSVWLSLFYLKTLVVFDYIFITFAKYIIEEKERRFIKGAFSQYLSADFVNQLVSNPDLLRLGGDEKELTVIFSDIENFTNISEKLSPAYLVESLNKYTTEMSDIIMKFDGTIDKYSGDSIMAFFGAPIFFESHAKSACEAALGMQKRLREIYDDSTRLGIPFFSTRIGINTGKMVVGNMGSRDKFNYTVLGDSVNLASRLEGANKFYGTKIIIGEDTYNKLDNTFITRNLDIARVVGKTRPVRIYELIGLKDDGIFPDTAEFLKFYNDAVDLFFARKWRGASSMFNKALDFKPNDLMCQIYISRCAGYIESPPADETVIAFDLKSK